MIPRIKSIKPIEQVQLDESRTCVYWNDVIDLPSDAIYHNVSGVNQVFAEFK